LAELGVAIKSYYSVIKDSHIKERIKEGTIKASLLILAKYFINYSASDFGKLL
jgi:hypothetical protein